MFSTTQIEFLQSYMPTLRQEGYKYYLAITNTMTDYYMTVEPDIYIYATKEPIDGQTAYTYQVPEGIVVSVRTPNYSTNGTAVNTARVVKTNYVGGIVSVDVYEHIYTNAEMYVGTAVQPDILQKGGYMYENEQANTFFNACILFVVLLFAMFGVYGKRGRK